MTTPAYGSRLLDGRKTDDEPPQVGTLLTDKPLITENAGSLCTAAVGGARGNEFEAYCNGTSDGLRRRPGLPDR